MGKTDRYLLKVDFSKGFSLSANPKHEQRKWSKKQKIINEINFPHGKLVREESK